MKNRNILVALSPDAINTIRGLLLKKPRRLYRINGSINNTGIPVRIHASEPESIVVIYLIKIPLVPAMQAHNRMARIARVFIE